MLSANSEGAPVITLQFAPLFDIYVPARKAKAIHAAQTYLPPQVPTPQFSDTVNPAGAPILTLLPTAASLYIPPGCSKAAPCAKFEAEEEEPSDN
jgi:multidrug efflux pump subunit AcrB